MIRFAKAVAKPVTTVTTAESLNLTTIKKKPLQKLTLPQLESFLFKAADILRGKMDASEFKEFIFGMLFLKRLSDEFDHKREQLRNKDFAYPKDQPDLVKELLEDKTSYGDTFFVPVRARWHEAWLDENGDLVACHP
jgi:type I restriction enzyme M protein